MMSSSTTARSLAASARSCRCQPSRRAKRAQSNHMQRQTREKPSWYREPGNLVERSTHNRGRAMQGGAMSTKTMSGRELIAHWIEPNPYKPGEGEARIRDTGVPV